MIFFFHLRAYAQERNLHEHQPENMGKLGISHGLTLSLACLTSIPTCLWRTPLHGHISNVKEAGQGNPVSLEVKGENWVQMSSPVLSYIQARMPFSQPTVLLAPNFNLKCITW